MLSERQALSEGVWLLKAFLQHTGGCCWAALKKVGDFSPHAGLLLCGELRRTRVPVNWASVKHSNTSCVCSFSLGSDPHGNIALLRSLCGLQVQEMFIFQVTFHFDTLRHKNIISGKPYTGLL